MLILIYNKGIMDGNNLENNLDNKQFEPVQQPVAPTVPAAPVEPVAPTAPVMPTEPIAPVASAEPIISAAPATTPVVAATESVELTTQPVESTKLAELAESMQTASDAQENKIDEAVANVMAESAEVKAADKMKKNDKIILIVLGVIVGILVIVMAVTLIVMNLSKGANSVGGNEGNSGVVIEDEDGDDEPIENTELSAGTVTTTIDGQEVAYSAAYLVDGIDATIGSGTYESAVDGQAVFLVINGGSLTIKGEVNINKTGTGALQGEGGDSYGLNSAIVVFGEGSSATINGATITTSALGANAIVAMAGATVDVQDATIETSADNSRGLYVVYGGAITANTVTISTRGSSSAALATDRGEGSITASDMVLSTEGAGSPLIYSTGEITVSSSTGTANGAQIAVIDGKNSITLDGCDFSTNGIGNRNSIDNAAVMIYQSTPSDASEEAGSFTATDSTFTILSSSSVYTTAPFFFITNTVADINLTDVKASFYADGYFVLASGTSEWGTPGENGATVTFSAVRLDATNQNIGIDENSSVTGL